tara:strand:+ start:210 stop:2318 length:2109 start_codon:yes stop_codon:yes gene_type:complete
MITDLNKILVEWAYRTNDGKPDANNSAKLLTLESVLKDFGWSREARAELLNTLMETDIVKNKDSGNIYTVQKHNPNTQSLVKKDASDAEVAKVTKKKVDKEKDEEKPKVSKLSQNADRARELLGIEKSEDVTESQKKKDIDSLLQQVGKNIDKLSDEEKKSVSKFFESLNVLYSNKSTDEEKEDAWREINVSASPNRQKLYLDDLRGESGLYKILGEGKSAIRSRLVDEVSKYKDIPEDDNKNYIKAESLAKPDIGGGKPARAANKKKSGKYIDEIADTNVDKVMSIPPLNRITKPAFRTLFGPIGEDGNLIIPSSKNSRKYFEHSVNNNTSLKNVSNFLRELSEEGKAPKELSESIDGHQKRLQKISKNYEIPSEKARKAVEESYAILAEKLHEASPEYAGRLLKQFAEMEQYDSEIAGGDECYLPGHGSFPGGDKLLIEKGDAGGKQVSFISIKYGKSGSKKRTVYGCPANMSALQQIHPDESKRESLGQYVGQPNYTLAVKDDLIDTPEKAEETITDLLNESELGDLFNDGERKELSSIVHSTKERTEELRKEATGSDGKVDWKKFNELRKNDEVLINDSRKLRQICNEEKLSTLIGQRNSEALSKKLSPEVFISSVVFVNQVKTSNGYEFLKHNKQFIENGEIKNETISGGTDMDGWYINPRMNRTPGRNGGGIQSSYVGTKEREDINSDISNSENII